MKTFPDPKKYPDMLTYFFSFVELWRNNYLYKRGNACKVLSDVFNIALE